MRLEEPKSVNVVLHRLDRSGGCRVLLRAADALAREGYVVRLVVPKGGGSEASFPTSQSVFRVDPGPHVGWRGPAGTLVRTLLLGWSMPRADLALFGYYVCGLPCALAVAAGRLRAAVYVVQADEPLIVGGADDGFGWLRRMLALLVLRLPFKRIANSRYTRDLVRDRVGRVPDVVHPGVDTGVFFPSERPTGEPKACVAVAGNQRWSKGWSDAVATLAAVSRARPEFDVLVIGGDLDGSLAFLGNRARAVQPTGDTEVASALRQASVFLTCSSSEGFGLMVLESMAVGTPVVAMDSGGVRDIIEDGCNGMIISSGDSAAAARAVMRLWDDRDFWSQLRAEGTRAARRFSWESFEDGIATQVGVLLGPKGGASE